MHSIAVQFLFVLSAMIYYYLDALWIKIPYGIAMILIAYVLIFRVSKEMKAKHFTFFVVILLHSSAILSLGARLL